ncbi:YgiT-type zinc finger protein [Desulfonatronospira sp.]|uniref:YgiT-type zinc finger protein n=1 Tax=Desulfonatronospira sp. TaxID=1962951 RepID=UPI0025C00BF4|nr:YgiT-type zinc finger protein [Desulfonatronospira sp.]
MKCHLCGGRMDSVCTDLPFKLDQHRIVVVKDIPVEQCNSCSEFLISDPVMENLDSLISTVDSGIELEVRRFAA